MKSWNEVNNECLTIGDDNTLHVSGTVKSGGPRFRTVLFGDSMTSQYMSDIPVSNCTYDKTTGLLTIPDTGHTQSNGWMTIVFNRNYADTKIHQYLPITVVDANSFTVDIGKNLNLPETLTGSTYYRPDNRIAANGWFTWLQGASGYRFNVLYNGAQSGDTTTDNLNRLKKHCLDFDPEVVFMQLAGINDCSAGQLLNEEQIWANQKSIMDQIHASGALLVVLTVTPVASGEARGTLQNMTRVARMRQRLFNYSKENPGVIVVDTYRRVVDPTNSTGLAQATKLKSSDKIHYSILGAREIGEAVWRQISALFPAQADSLPASRIDCYASSAISPSVVTRAANVLTVTATNHGFLSNEIAKITGGTSEVLNAWAPVTVVNANTLTMPYPGTSGTITGAFKLGRSNNLFPNPTLATNTGGTVSAPVTGTAAGNLRCRVYGSITTATASVVADGDGFGNRQRLVATPAAADDRMAIEMTATSLVNNDVKPGRKYYAEAWIKLDGVAGSNLSELGFRLMVNVDGVIRSAYAFNNYDSTSISTNFEGMVRTATITLPAGTLTQFYWEFSPRFSAAGTDLTIEIGRINLVEVDGL